MSGGASTSLIWVGVLLMVAGATIALVLLQLRRTAQRQQQLTARLNLLNETCGLDLPSLLRSAWPELSAAGLAGASWRLEWFGVTREQSHGEPVGHAWTQSLRLPDVALDLTLHLGVARGEARYFRESIAQTFWLLAQIDAFAKRVQVDRTLMQHERVASFVGHDVKNIAQFIALAAQQVAQARQQEPPGVTDSLAARLAQTLPLVQARCEEALRQLNQRLPGASAAGAGARAELPPASARVDLRELIAPLGLLHGVAIELVEEPPPASPGTPGRPDSPAQLQPMWVAGPQPTLATLLDNLIKNHRDHCTVRPLPALRVSLRHAGSDIELRLASPLEHGLDMPERLFEPFATTSRQGMGVGLHQARLLARSLGGSLSLEDPSGPASSPPQLVFVLRLPHDIPGAPPLGQS